jgi:hypothetical protein
MSNADLAHLELLAEVDALVARLRRWADAAPAWQPAETCQALVRRLAERADALKVRLEAPLVVATLGGTGTGKSALVNALLGAEVVETGRRRPTTMRPTVICRPGVTPAMLGLEAASVELLERDLPALSELVLIDCPDPDTTEEPPVEAATVRADESALPPAAAGSNLARLRQILPRCDVILVTATQQKYRSARVGVELAAAAAGARLVFVQTHADTDADIRDDWRRGLEGHYSTGQMFLVDSPAALTDAQNHRQPRGDFAELANLLTRQLAGAAAARIRRANFLDLAADVLAGCRRRLDESLPGLQQVEAAIDQQRGVLAGELAEQLRNDLLASRRPWESRLLGQTASRWGFSPFALVLRIYQGLGGLLSGTLLWRVRTPAQLALWGAVTGAQSVRNRSRQRQAEGAPAQAAARCWDAAALQRARLVLEGYTREAGLQPRSVAAAAVNAEAQRAGAGFVGDVSGQLQSLIARLAERHTGFCSRFCYEVLLAAMLGVLLYRLGRNFFYDSWLAPQPVPTYGLDFYVAAAFWLVLWCLLLVWAFSRRLRRGLRREIDDLARSWTNATTAGALFAGLENQCRAAADFRTELQRIDQHVTDLRRQLAETAEPLGRRR